MLQTQASLANFAPSSRMLCLRDFGFHSCPTHADVDRQLLKCLVYAKRQGPQDEALIRCLPWDNIQTASMMAACSPGCRLCNISAPQSLNFAGPGKDPPLGSRVNSFRLAPRSLSQPTRQSRTSGEPCRGRPGLCCARLGTSPKPGGALMPPSQLRGRPCSAGEPGVQQSTAPSNGHIFLADKAALQCRRLTLCGIIALPGVACLQPLSAHTCSCSVNGHQCAQLQLHPRTLANFSTAHVHRCLRTYLRLGHRQKQAPPPCSDWDAQKAAEELLKQPKRSQGDMPLVPLPAPPPPQPQPQAKDTDPAPAAPQPPAAAAVTSAAAAPVQSLGLSLPGPSQQLAAASARPRSAGQHGSNAQPGSQAPFAALGAVPRRSPSLPPAQPAVRARLLPEGVAGVRPSQPPAPPQAAQKRDASQVPSQLAGQAADPAQQPAKRARTHLQLSHKQAEPSRAATDTPGEAPVSPDVPAPGPPAHAPSSAPAQQQGGKAQLGNSQGFRRSPAEQAPAAEHSPSQRAQVAGLFAVQPHIRIAPQFSRVQPQPPRLSLDHLLSPTAQASQSQASPSSRQLHAGPAPSPPPGHALQSPSQYSIPPSGSAGRWATSLLDQLPAGTAPSRPALSSSAPVRGTQPAAGLLEYAMQAGHASRQTATPASLQPQHHPRAWPQPQHGASQAGTYTHGAQAGVSSAQQQAGYSSHLASLGQQHHQQHGRGPGGSPGPSQVMLEPSHIPGAATSAAWPASGDICHCIGSGR